MAYMRTSLVSTLIVISVLTAISLSSPPALKLQSFTLDRSQAPGGVAVIGTLVLSRNAPKQGAIVVIDAIDATIAIAPLSVQFNQGESIKQFIITGVPRCDHLQINVRCTLGVSLVQSLTFREPSISISFTPNPVIGGNEAVGTITLDGPAPDCQ